MSLLEDAIKYTKEQFSVANSEELSQEREFIDKYSKVFSLSHIDDLQWKEFHDFLKEEYKKPWSLLYLYSTKLEANFDKLKIVLKILLDESKPIGERLRETVSDKGKFKVPKFGPAVATAILIVVFPEKYAVYNGTVVEAMNLIQNATYSTTRNYFAEHYEEFNKYANDLAKQHGISLWELNWAWQYITEHPEENIARSGYQKALKRIIELYGEINKNCDLLTSKDKVMSEYQKSFSPSNIKNIEKDEFINFLNFKTNNHWSGLHRQAKNITSDMEKLRKTLSELLDDSKDIKDRIDNMYIGKVNGRYLCKVKGLDHGIYTPILMIGSNQKFAVWNSKSEGFLSRYAINPSKKGKSPGKYYEEVNDRFNGLSKGSGLDMWTLDALFYYDDFYSEQIPAEIKDRKELWDNLSKNPDGRVPVSELSRAKLPIDQSGSFSPKDSGLGEIISRRILITDTQYKEIIEEGGLNYKPSKTGKQQQDEIEGIIGAMQYQVPIFVIIGKRDDKEFRKVKIGLVRAYNEMVETFLVDVFDHWPNHEELVFKSKDEEETEFDPYSKDTDSKKALNDIRPGQAKFKFDVIKKYGARCAVCGVDLKEVLEAAHIVPKSEHGVDDSRNGLILCANHHKMFDGNLFAIDTNYKLVFRKGYNKDNLMINVENLSRLADKPDKRAIIERYKMFKKVE